MLWLPIVSKSSKSLTPEYFSNIISNHCHPWQSLSQATMAFFLFPEQARHFQSQHLYICQCLHKNTYLQSQIWLAPFSSFSSQLITYLKRSSSFSILSSETGLISQPQVNLVDLFLSQHLGKSEIILSVSSNQKKSSQEQGWYLSCSLLVSLAH